MEDTSSQRSTATLRVHAAVCVGTLVICAVAQIVLHRAWPAPIVSTIFFWFAPWAIAFTFLLHAHRRARIDAENILAVTRDRDMIRTLIDSLPDFIYVKDVQCRFLLANRFCCEAMGTSAAMLSGKTDFDFYPADLAKSFYEDEQKVLRSGEALLARQEDVVDRNGSMFTILTTKVPLRDANGSIVGIMGIGRNITARVAAERQLKAAQEAAAAEMRERERMAIELRLAQKLESVGRLAAGLAHEINTPIQYVGDSVHFLRSAFEDFSKLFLAYRETATRQTADPSGVEILSSLRAMEESLDYQFLAQEVPKALERTIEGIDRVAAIVRAMKDFAHPDTSEHKPADINRALSTTLTVARGEYRYAARVETHFGNLPEVICNIGELNQVFLNLLVNAAHAICDAGMDCTSGVIEIRTQLAGDEVQITIADNGCGIPLDNLEKIFDPFFTSKEVGRGTGQGLAIARSIIVDKHAGHIEVSSRVGFGTQFVIRIPVLDRSGPLPQP